MNTVQEPSEWTLYKAPNLTLKV